MINNQKNTDIILSSLAEAVVTVDRDFRINFVNNAAEKLTGFRQNDILGKYCKSYFASQFCENNCPIIRVLQSGKNIYDLDTELHSDGGEKIPVRLNVAVLKDENNRPTGGVITIRDMSELKKYDDLLKDKSGFHGIIGSSKEMREIYSVVESISDSDVPVLILGETGTGKELVANAIHKTSKRASKSYIKINCSIFPPNLISSELFGHTKGAFTDARENRVGRFENAHEGTVFLDEIGDLPSETQPQLLRFLQDGSFERLGESAPRYSDVRTITATNIDIEEAIELGKFRNDLYYRLHVVTISLPPLRERKSDIALLIHHFLKRFNTIYNKQLVAFEDNAIDALHNWDFPGNIRELENIVEYAVIRSKDSSKISICNLPAKIRDSFDCTNKNTDFRNNLGTEELILLLNKHKWNKSKVSEILGINRTTLWRMLKESGLN